MPVALLVALGGLFLGLGLWQAWSDAPTYDEPTYVASGVLAVTAHDVSLGDEHPALGKALAALPVLLAHPVIPPGYRHMDQHPYAVRFVQAQLRAGKLRRVVFLARLVPLAEALGVGLVLFRLARSLFGPWAAALAAAMWLADPLTLGLGHLDGVDVPMSLATLLLGWALLGALRAPSVGRLSLLGGACAAVVLANDDGLGLALAAAVVVVVAGWSAAGWRAVARAVPVAAAGWAGVAAAYAVFDPGALLPYVVVPAPYLQGLRYLLAHDTRPATGYLLGQSWTGGRWWYWPVGLAVKVPWALLVLLVAAPLCWLRAAMRRQRDVIVAFGVPATVLAVELLTVQRDIGVRYALPLVALGALFAAPLAELPGRLQAVGGAHGNRPGPRRYPIRALATTLIALPAVALAQTVASAPHSLAWVDPGLGPGYRAASNSSEDWGQDFYALSRWASSHRAFAAYGGFGLGVGDIPGARPLLLGGRAVPAGQVRGWVAVTASVLTAGGYPGLGWLRAYCPVGILDGTVLLYRFVSAPSGAPGPVEPAPVCAHQRQVSTVAPPPVAGSALP